MNKELLNPFETRLLQERKQLLERIAAQRGGAVSRADMAAEHFSHSEESHAQTMSERENEFAMNEHETAELAQLDAALARIQSGEYGSCMDCGVDIPAERLQAAPQALRCISCQTRAEQHA
jgi:DnaK suppressor protein